MADLSSLNRIGNNLDHKRSPHEGFEVVCPKAMKSNCRVTDISHSARVVGGGSTTVYSIRETERGWDLFTTV